MYNIIFTSPSHECHKCISFLAVKQKGTVPIISGTITAIFYFQTRVSECLLLNANSAIYQLYHGKNKSIFNKLMRFPLYKTNTPSWILIVLAHWNKSVDRHVAPFEHIILIQSTSLRSFSLAQKQQIPIL